MEEDDEYLKRVAKALSMLDGLETLDQEQMFLLKKILRGESNEENNNQI